MKHYATAHENVHCEPVGPFETNCFLIWDPKTQEAALIDPGDAPELLSEQVEKRGLTLRHILITHGHLDHIGAVSALKKKYPAVIVAAGKDEEKLLLDPELNLSSHFDEPFSVGEMEKALLENDTIQVGSLSLRVLSTPGHTPGGVSYSLEKANPPLIFAGDTLFRESVGRTDFPSGNSKQLIEAIRAKIMTRPDETVVYPGHGPYTKVGHERKNNPYL